MKRLGKALILSTSILVGAPSISMIPLGINAAEASSTKISKTYYQTTANLNLRSGASTKSKLILTIPKGKIVTSIEKKGTWSKVSYTYKSKGKNITKTGWVSTKYLKEDYQYSTIKTAYVFTSKQTSLYSTPDTKKKGVTTVSSNNGFASTQKIVNSKRETWYRISFEGKTLYINSKNVKTSSFSSLSNKTYTVTEETTLYKSYGTAYQQLATIPEDTVLPSSKRIGDWYNVTYNGTSGYVHSDYISETPKDSSDIEKTPITDTTFVTTAEITLNKEPDEFAEVTDTIPNATIIVATHKLSNGWYQVNYDEQTGYIADKSIEQVRTGDPLTERDGYQFIDLRTSSPVTAEQIDSYIEENAKARGATSVLIGKGQNFIDAGNKYGVNALYLAAHAIHESAYGTSQISLGKNNLFGFGSYDATPFIASYRFSSVDANIEYIAQQIKATYLNPSDWRYKGPYLGFSTKDMNNKRLNANSEGMNFYYASDPNWGKGIARHMQAMLPYDKAYYSKAQANTTIPPLPALPTGSDIFPEGIQGQAKRDLVLHSEKGANDKVFTLKKGNSFILLEKTNDYWVKVQVDDTIYWTNDINFVQYKNFISVQNLGRTNVDSLNVRAEPTTAADKITSLPLNEYVHLVLNQDGSITTDSSKKWYQIQLADGTTGWVSSMYIIKELN